MYANIINKNDKNMTISKYKSNQKRNRNNCEEDNVFKTADFILSVFLFYSGVELLKVEAYPDDRNKNKKMFVFKKTDQIEVLMNHYIASDPSVKLKKFVNAQKIIKKKIYE